MPVFNKLLAIWSNLSLKKRLAFIGIVIILIIIVINQRNAQNNILTVPAQKGEVTETVVSGGNLSAGGEAPIYSSVTGIISDIYINNNDTVQKGQKLFRVKSTATPQEKSSAKAIYQAAIAGSNTSEQGKLTLQSQLEEARQAVLTASTAVNYMNDRVANGKTNPTTGKDYTQEEKDVLLSALTSSKQNFTAVEKKYKEYDQNIVAAKEQLNAAKDNYQATIDMDTVAPTDGEIVNLLMRKGDKVTAFSSQAQVTTPVLYLIGTESYAVKIELNEFDVYKVKSGQQATIVFDAFPEQTFQGTIGKIDTIGTKRSSTVTYNALVDLTGGEVRLKPGMTAKVSVITNKRSNVLIIPNSALRKENNKTVVNVLKDGKITSKEVTLGLRGDTTSEVQSGLTEDENVVVSTL